MSVKIDWLSPFLELRRSFGEAGNQARPPGMVAATALSVAALNYTS